MLNILRRSPAQKSQDREAGKNYGPGKRDALTGAVNKSAFQKIVEDALAGEHMQGCLLLVDVDHMHTVRGKRRNCRKDIFWLPAWFYSGIYMISNCAELSVSGSSS